MPFGADAFVNIRDAIQQNLFDLMTRQAILNVRVDRGATAVRLRFDTVWPSYATVEIFHMVHGELSLDMENENLFRTEIELFGDARLQHDVTVRNLEQERRYWFRISVPRRTEAEPTASGKVRARGEFATKRRDIAGNVEVIHVFDDSDTSGAGELSFSGAAYDATIAGGARLTAPQFSVQREVDSGQDFDSPFDNLLAVGRAPDRIGIFVIGRDDDRDASDILYAPWEGLGLVGFRPPDRLPTEVAAVSTHSRDQSEALGFVTLRNFTPRSAKPFSFESINGALHFSCSGHLLTNIIDTLGERAVPPWKLVKRTKMMLARKGRAAGMLGLRSGRVALALSTEGVLSVRSEAAATWQARAEPPLDALLVHLLHDGGQLLAGQDGRGGLHVARCADIGVEAPRWQALEASARDLPLTIEGADGAVHLLGEGDALGLWHARVGPDGALAQPPRQLDRPADERIAAAAGRDGRLVVAAADAEELLHVLTLERDGGLADRRRLDRFGVPLALALDPDEGLLLAALDREDKVGVCRLDDPAAGFEPIGTLDEVLEGLLPPVPLAPPTATAA